MTEPHAPAPHAPESHAPKILVLDDEEHITEMVAMGLKYNGFEADLVTAANHPDGGAVFELTLPSDG